MRWKPLSRRLALGLAVRRRPRLRRALALAVGLLSGAAVVATVQGADHTRARWGHTTAVVVATRDIGAGVALDPHNTRVVHRPIGLVPAGALRSVPPAARLATPVFAGELVRQERLATMALSAVAARLPAGTRAMAVPVEPGAAPALSVGDRVDVVVALSPDAAGGGPAGFVLTSAVPVVDVAEGAVTVAVERDVAPRLAVALGAGAVTLALVGGAEDPRG